MKIKLIAPKMSEDLISQHYKIAYEFIGPPVKTLSIPEALPLLAALTPADIEVSICDENVTSLDFDEPVDLVGVTGMTATANRMYEIADEYRRRGVAVVLGGVHASLLPEEAAEHCDALVMGEAELVWKDLLEDFSNGELKTTYKSETFPSLESLPVPRWDLIDLKSYLYMGIQTTRGCPNQCSFCTVYAMTGRKLRHKPIENVLHEIKTLIALTGNKHITFMDDNIFGDKRYAKELFRALVPLGIRWIGQVSLKLTQDEELLSLAAASGMYIAYIGIESVSQGSLESVNKGHINDISSYKKSIETIRQHGIEIYAYMIVGLDCDSASVFEETHAFIQEINFPLVFLSVPTPLPGTEFYRTLERENRILHTDWSAYMFTKVCVKPKQISAQTLQSGYHMLLKELYQFGHCLQRLIKEWERGLLINATPLPWIQKTVVSFRLIMSMMKLNLFQNIPAVLYYVGKKNAQLAPILLALHFHYAVHQLEAPSAC